ncbi:TldD/PmbA family protein [Intestinibacter bartlettii]|uniref:TldD/PmbA family protein n=1 Tax=Intestinibacter bartlettii TaxID=261299 RepID=A0ABS6DV77_9FIRM|nr:TldD/PmbA family protein [Intestinibacter bartlettii]MBU5335743.1 TldD/PmbA family protein [Intestinibacter bartlettii]MDO5009759.1 TldD/PmbA family protein [Intestinibacter bartlettii]
MNLNEFKKVLFEKSKEAGFESGEIYVTNSESLNISIYKQEVESYNLNKSFGLSFRGIINGKIGYSHTRILDENSIDMLINTAKNAALLIENEDTQFIYEGDDKYNKVVCYHDSLDNINPSDLIDLGLQMERECKNYNENVINTGGCKVIYSKGEVQISNTKGLDLKNKENILYAYIVPIVEINGEKQDGTGYKVATNIDEMDPKEIAKMGVDEAISKINSKSIKTGNYKIALYNEAMVSLLSAFCGVFSADATQKGLSLLKDKENTMIASEKVTIIDNPLLDNGLSSAPFDDEGVATFKKEIVSKGKLTTLLHNLKTANKANTKSTGNGFKASYASSVSVSPSNFYIEKGDSSFDKILQTIGEGILITDFAGLHSGANAITGDFSLAAKGFYIKEGKKDHPVDQITVAGNFFDLLKQIEVVGDDLKFPLSSIGSPTVIAKGLSIAGK